MAHLNKSETGSSFIEVLIAMVVTLSVIGILSTLISGVQTSYSLHRNRTEAVSDANAALDMFTRLARMAGNNPSNIAGLQGIDPGTADGAGKYRTIRLRADWRGNGPSDPPDGDTNDSMENVRFYVENNKLMLQEGAGTAVAYLDNVRSIEFRYYNSNNTLITNAAAIPGNTSRIEAVIMAAPKNTTVMAFETSATLRKKG